LVFAELARGVAVHIHSFRCTIAVDPYSSLVGFCGGFATRPSAQRTVYRFDAPPA
jgi:hypothetical protein